MSTMASLTGDAASPEAAKISPSEITQKPTKVMTEERPRRRRDSRSSSDDRE